MIEAFLTNLYAIIGALLLASFVGYVQWRNNFKVRRAAACATFRAALNNEITALESTGMAVSTRNLFLSVHQKHSAAISEFRRYLFWRGRSFDKCWKQHYYGHSFDAAAFEIPEKDRLYLIYLAITEAEEKAAKALAIKNIHALLRFAKQT